MEFTIRNSERGSLWWATSFTIGWRDYFVGMYGEYVRSSSTTMQNEKKRTYVRTTRAVLPPKIPALWSERTRSAMSRVFSMNYRCISVRQVPRGNYFIYTLSYIFYSPLMLRHRADGGIAKYCILRYTWFRRQKHVTSSTCRHSLERSRVKSSTTNIPLYLWYVLCEYSTEGT